MPSLSFFKHPVVHISVMFQRLVSEASYITHIIYFATLAARCLCELFPDNSAFQRYRIYDSEKLTLLNDSNDNDNTNSVCLVTLPIT